MTEKLNSKISQYLGYRKLNKFFLALLGWSNSSTTYRFLPYTYLLICTSMVCFIFNFVRVYHNNVLLVTNCLTSMTGFIIVSLKMLCLIKHKKEVFELYELLDGHIMNLLKKDHLSHFILHEINRYRFLSWNITLSVVIVDIIFNVLPLITIVSNRIHHIQPNRYIFIYPSLFPWPVPFTGFVYRLHFLFESIASWAIVILTVAVDSIFIFFVFLIIGQLREISYNITHIDDKSDSNVIVKRCITQYCTLIKCCNNLQKIYGPIILCLMTTNAVVLCTLIYQISQMKSLTILKAVLFFLYIYLKIIQTYMYSWCGTHLTLESEEYRNAIYAANWYGNKRFMTAIIIMLQQKPLVLTACNFSVVSIDVFAKILNTSISYYFLLKTLE